MFEPFPAVEGTTPADSAAYITSLQSVEHSRCAVYGTAFVSRVHSSSSAR